MVNLSTYSTRSHQVRFITMLGILINLRLIIPDQIFLKTFFPYIIIECNKLDSDVCTSKSYAPFRNTLLKSGRPINVPFIISIILQDLNSLLVLSYLNEHRCNRNFQNCITLFKVVALNLNQALIFYCSAIIIQTFV